MSPQIGGVAAAEEAEADRELCTERSKSLSPVFPSAAYGTTSDLPSSQPCENR